MQNGTQSKLSCGHDVLSFVHQDARQLSGTATQALQAVEINSGRVHDIGREDGARPAGRVAQNSERQALSKIRRG